MGNDFRTERIAAHMISVPDGVHRVASGEARDQHAALLAK
jgi:hypothetical protein